MEEYHFVALKIRIS